MNAKIYNGNVQPNHKEYKIWVNNEGVIKTWNGTEWIEQSGESGGTSSKYTPKYYDVSKLPDEFYEQLGFASSVKLMSDGNITICPIALSGSLTDDTVIACSFCPAYLEINGNYKFVSSMKELFYIIAGENDEEVDKFISYFTEITEEEYYKID